jgi:hypothetical protein
MPQDELTFEAPGPGTWMLDNQHDHHRAHDEEHYGGDLEHTRPTALDRFASRHKPHTS